MGTTGTSCSLLKHPTLCWLPRRQKSGPKKIRTIDPSLGSGSWHSRLILIVSRNRTSKYLLTSKTALLVQNIFSHNLKRSKTVMSGFSYTATSKVLHHPIYFDMMLVDPQVVHQFGWNVIHTLRWVYYEFWEKKPTDWFKTNATGSCEQVQKLVDDAFESPYM